jgi:electron transport complex protein RnfB
MQPNKQELLNKINNILPQTQCTRCTYPSCNDYALAIIESKAKINQCPPGGQDGVKKLANILNIEEILLDSSFGVVNSKNIAVIDEDICIGCTLCIKACPVDAIIGSNKMIHNVISSQCTGCDLCLAVCPVDCIEMIPDENQSWNQKDRSEAKIRFEKRNNRLEREQKERESRLKIKPKINL